MLVLSYDLGWGCQLEHLYHILFTWLGFPHHVVIGFQETVSQDGEGTGQRARVCAHTRYILFIEAVHKVLLSYKRKANRLILTEPSKILVEHSCSTGFYQILEIQLWPFLENVTCNNVLWLSFCGATDHLLNDFWRLWKKKKT